MVAPKICPCWAARMEQRDKEKERQRVLTVWAWVVVGSAALMPFLLGVMQ